MSKPREFWISQPEDPCYYGIYLDPKHVLHDLEVIHVIEKSAYDTAMRLIDYDTEVILKAKDREIELQAQCDKLALLLKEMLQNDLDNHGYGNVEDWNTEMEQELGWGESCASIQSGRALVEYRKQKNEV